MTYILSRKVHQSNASQIFLFMQFRIDSLACRPNLCAGDDSLVASRLTTTALYRSLTADNSFLDEYSLPGTPESNKK
jgi:hypothetical protein